MPTSWDIFDEDSRAIIKAITPKMVLDVGPGMGKYGKMVREANLGGICTIVAYEAEQSYIKAFSLKSIYNDVFWAEANQIMRLEANRRWDLCIFGDVLEHMPKSEGLDLIHFLLYRARFILMTVPLQYLQEDVGGVERERHISSWHPDEYRRYTDVVQNFAMADDTETKETKAVAFQALLRGFLCSNKDWNEVTSKWKAASQKRLTALSDARQRPISATN